MIRCHKPDIQLKISSKEDPILKQIIQEVCQTYFESWCSSFSTKISTSTDTDTHIILYNKYRLNISFTFSKHIYQKGQEKEETWNQKRIKIKLLLKRRLQKECEHDLFVPLQHQQDFVNYWYKYQGYQILTNLQYQNAFLLFCSMGSGKSQASLLPWSYYFVNKIIILCQNTMIETWVRFIRSLPQPSQEDKENHTYFEILGLTEFSRQICNKPDFLKNKYVIFDEAHMFRNITEQMQLQINALRQAKCLLHLTGTPLVNARSDLIGLGQIMLYNFTSKQIELLNGLSNESNDQIIISKMVSDIFTHKIHYYDPGGDNSCYAPITRIIKEVPMSWFQTIDYLVMKKQSFTIGDLTIQSSRRNSYHANEKICSNGAVGLVDDSNKIDSIVQDTLNFPDGYGQIIYSNYLNNGILKIYHKLEKAEKWKVRLTTGKTVNKERNKAFDEYNHKQIHVLCMSCIGGVGLSFRNSRVLRLTDAFENLQMENQCIARISRYKSHEQKGELVQAIKYISIFPLPLVSKNEMQKVMDYFYKTYCSKQWGTAMDLFQSPELFMKYIYEKIEIEEKGETIDQQLQRTNSIKQETLLPILFQMSQLGNI